MSDSVLPDCMMPDGGDCCRGYHELRVRYAELEREYEELQKQPCPFIATSDEGTSYCKLAETFVEQLERENAGLKRINSDLQENSAGTRRDFRKAYARLERENAELRAQLAEFEPVEGNFIASIKARALREFADHLMECAGNARNDGFPRTAVSRELVSQEAMDRADRIERDPEKQEDEDGCK